VNPFGRLLLFERGIFGRAFFAGWWCIRGGVALSLFLCWSGWETVAPLSPRCFLWRGRFAPRKSGSSCFDCIGCQSGERLPLDGLRGKNSPLGRPGKGIVEVFAALLFHGARNRRRMVLLLLFLLLDCGPLEFIEIHKMFVSTAHHRRDL